MPQIKVGNPAGFFNAFAWNVDSSGYCQGTEQSAIAAGDTSHGLRIIGPKAFNFSPPTRTVTPFQGGDRLLGQISFGLTEFGTFTLDTSELDLSLWTMAGGSTVDQTNNTLWSMAAPNYNLSTLPYIGLMMTAIYQSRESGSDGATKYINYIFPRCQIAPNFTPLSYQAENVSSYQVTPTITDTLPTGETLHSELGLADNKDVGVAVVTDYPLAITAYTHDNSGTTFTLAYQPVSTVVTVNATNTYYVEGGTTEALASVVTATGVCTVDGAAASGVKSVTLYETQFAAVARRRAMNERLGRIKDDGSKVYPEYDLLGGLYARDRVTEKKIGPGQFVMVPAGTNPAVVEAMIARIKQAVRPAASRLAKAKKELESE